MDMSLFRHAAYDSSAGRCAARIDYGVFVATLQAHQLGTATARAGSRCGGPGGESPHLSEPLADILLGGRHWQEAVLAQGGSFNPAFARRSPSF